MVRCSNEVEGQEAHAMRPLVVTVMGLDSNGPDGALCPPCLARLVAGGPASTYREIPDAPPS